MTDRDTEEGTLADDGLWIAVALLAAVVIALGIAAYLYWSGTGKLPWA